jgi:hypothetical protein
VEATSKVQPVKKKLVRILSYLPIILLGAAGSVVVIDMWHKTQIGQKKSETVRNQHQGSPIDHPSPAGSPARLATP